MPQQEGRDGADSGVLLGERGHGRVSEENLSAFFSRVADDVLVLPEKCFENTARRKKSPGQDEASFSMGFSGVPHFAEGGRGAQRCCESSRSSSKALG